MIQMSPWFSFVSISETISIILVIFIHAFVRLKGPSLTFIPLLNICQIWTKQRQKSLSTSASCRGPKKQAALSDRHYLRDSVMSSTLNVVRKNHEDAPWQE